MRSVFDVSRVGYCLTAVFSCLALLLVSCQSHQDEVVLSGETMGTSFVVKFIPPADAPEALRESVSREIVNVLEEIDTLMSTYNPDSELSRFNAFFSDAPFEISHKTLEVVEMAMEVSRLSDGAFDVTVGPIVNAYGFGVDDRPPAPPTDDQLDVLFNRVGFEMLAIDAAQRTISKNQPEIYCDLSGIAKGYGVDRIAVVLDSLDIVNYMVEIGGETRARGKNSRDQVWRIAIEKPDERGRAIQRVVELKDISIATSGDYRNFYIQNGVRISHTIDARSGRPIRHNLASVSVFHAECAMADALATAIMVLGPEEGMKLAGEHRLAVLMIVRTDAGGSAEKVSPEFERIFVKGESK